VDVVAAAPCSDFPQPQPTTMKSVHSVLSMILAVVCASCAGHPGVPSATDTYNGKPVLTRASHPAGGSMKEVDGVYLGRRYFTPPGSKSGLHWIDFYGQR
jgi:hypothetical protein